MAKNTTTQDPELMNLAQEFLKSPDAEKDQELFGLVNEFISSQKGEQPDPELKEATSSLQAIKELPTNAKIGFMNLGANALQIASRRGMQINYAAAKSFGFSDQEAEEITRNTFMGVKPEGGRKALLDMTESERLSAQSRTQGFGTGAEAMKVVSRAPFTLGAMTKGRAGEINAELPEATWSSNFITKSLRSTFQSGVPSIATAIGATLITGNPIIGLVSLGETEGASSFFDQIEGGASIPKASVISELSEAAEIATEALVFPKIFKGITKGVSLKQGIQLVVENAGQEAAAGFMQTFLQKYGLLTSDGMSKKEAATQAFEAGIKAVPESAWVGALTSGGATAVGSAVNSMTTKARKQTGQLESKAPGSITEEQTMPPPTSIAQSSQAASIEPIASTTMVEASAKTTMVDTQRDIAQGEGLDNTVQPVETLAAEVVDQSAKTTTPLVAEKIQKNSDAALSKLSDQGADLPSAFVSKNTKQGEAPWRVNILNQDGTPKDHKAFANEAEARSNLRSMVMVDRVKVLPVEPTKTETAKVEKQLQQKAFQIKSLQEELGLNDKDYRRVLYSTTQKNSTTAMGLNEMEAVLTELNFQKSQKYLVDEPPRLKMSEGDLSELKGFVEGSKQTEDVWRELLSNQLTPLPSDPFSHKKMWNIMKTDARKQQAFKTKQIQKTSLNTTSNVIANSAETVGNFFGSFQSYRNFFSDLEAQTGVPLFGRYQNLIDSSSTAKADSQRAFSNVLALHGKKSIPHFSKRQHQSMNRINRALYFGESLDIADEDLTPEQLQAREIMSTFTPEEQEHFDTLRDMFNSNPEIPNSGPNAVRLRGWQWRTWNKTYNELTPKIAEAEMSNKVLAEDLASVVGRSTSDLNKQLEAVDEQMLEIVEATPLESDAKDQIQNLHAEASNIKGETKPPNSETPIEKYTPKHYLYNMLDNQLSDLEGNVKNDILSVDIADYTWEQFFEETKGQAIGWTEDRVQTYDPVLKINALTDKSFPTEKRIFLQKKAALLQKKQEGKTPAPAQDPSIMVGLINERLGLVLDIKKAERGLDDSAKKESKKIKNKISRSNTKIKAWKKDIKNATPVQGKEGGGVTRASENTMQAGKKAQQEGVFYDWLGKQTFGTRDIYFVGQAEFDTWFKSVVEGMKPGKLGVEAGSPNTTISDTATRNRIKEGSPLLNKNPYLVAKTRLTQLSLLDELFSPSHDMNQDAEKAWDNMSSFQRKSYSKWMDNMMGVYDDAGPIIRPFQTVQKQWWRAYGWNPQRMAKFWARNVGQISLVAGQISPVRFTKAAPVAYAGYHLQARQNRIQEAGKVSEVDQVDMQDLQNQLRNEINNSSERSSAVMDPFLYEDWRQFAQTEVSQKAAQYAMLTQQESMRAGATDTSWQDIMPGGMGLSDTIGRWATWVPLHQMAFSNMKLLREGKIQDKQLWARLSLDTLENPQKKQLMALKEAGQDRQFVRKYANMKTKNVHYAYDLNERSFVEQHAGGRLIAGVITWPRSAMENYVRLAKQGQEGVAEGDLSKATEAAKGLIRYTAAFGLLGVLSARASRDPWYGIWRSVNPLNFIGSPQLTHMQETMDVLNNFWDGDLNNLPDDRAWNGLISELVDKGGVLMLPAAVGLMEGWKSGAEAVHGLKGINTVDLLQSTLKGKGVLYLGSEEAWRTESEKWLKLMFNEEKQETRDVKRIPGI